MPTFASEPSWSKSRHKNFFYYKRDSAIRWNGQHERENIGISCTPRCEVPLGKMRPDSVICFYLHRALFNLKRIAIHIQLTRSV